jgi:hypothetical protein
MLYAKAGYKVICQTKKQITRTQRPEMVGHFSSCDRRRRRITKKIFNHGRRKNLVITPNKGLDTMTDCMAFVRCIGLELRLQRVSQS